MLDTICSIFGAVNGETIDSHCRCRLMVTTKSTLFEYVTMTGRINFANMTTIAVNKMQTPVHSEKYTQSNWLLTQLSRILSSNHRIVFDIGQSRSSCSLKCEMQSALPTIVGWPQANYMTSITSSCQIAASYRVDSYLDVRIEQRVTSSITGGLWWSRRPHSKWS